MQTVQIPGIKIVHYCGGINFATRNNFKSELQKLVGFQPQKEHQLRKKIVKIADAVRYMRINYAVNNFKVS